MIWHIFTNHDLDQMKAIDKASDKLLGQYMDENPEASVNWLSDLVAKPDLLDELKSDKNKVPQQVLRRLENCRNAFIIEEPSADFRRRPAEVGLMLRLLEQASEGVVHWGGTNFGGGDVQLAEDAVKILRTFPVEKTFYSVPIAAEASNEAAVEPEENETPEDQLQLFFEQCEEDADLYTTLQKEMRSLSHRTMSYAQLVIQQPHLTPPQFARALQMGIDELATCRADLTRLIKRVREDLAAE